MNYSFLQCGEGALTVHLGDGIDPAVNRRVTALQGAIGSAGLRGITDLIPDYADLTVCYDCTAISAKALQRQLRRAGKGDYPLPSELENAANELLTYSDEELLILFFSMSIERRDSALRLDDVDISAIMAR